MPAATTRPAVSTITVDFMPAAIVRLAMATWLPADVGRKKDALRSAAEGFSCFCIPQHRWQDVGGNHRPSGSALLAARGARPRPGAGSRIHYGG